MLALVNGQILTPFRVVSGGIVLIEGDTIRDVGPAVTASDAEVLDVNGAWIAPGFIDTHVHGAGGFDVMEGADAVRSMARTLATKGVTSFLPTTLSLSWERIEAALADIDRVAGERTGGARVLGSHMEGPYCSATQAGAMNPRYLLEPRPEQYLPLLNNLTYLKRVSVAPELPGALELGRELRARGIVASVAHTDATFQQMVAAVESGYTHATHLYSAMSSIRRQNGYRLTGAIESVLLLDELTTELIADGHHLPPSLMKLAIKTKGVGAICAVTDSMAAAGAGPGSYTLGELEVIVEAAVPESFEIPADPSCLAAKLSDRSCFAGSVATMDQVVRNMMRLVGLNLLDAVRTATANPGRIHGLAGRGILAPGMKADIVILDEEITPLITIVEGETVWSKARIERRDSADILPPRCQRGMILR